MRSVKTICQESVLLFAVGAELRDRERVLITYLGPTYGYEVRAWKPREKKA